MHGSNMTCIIIIDIMLMNYFRFKAITIMIIVLKSFPVISAGTPSGYM